MVRGSFSKLASESGQESVEPGPFLFQSQEALAEAKRLKAEALWSEGWGGGELRRRENAQAPSMREEKLLVPQECPLTLFWGRVPLLNRLQKKGYPYSNLSTGGPIKR